MVIKMIRASGNPVDTKKLKVKEEEFKIWFDKICDKYGKFGETTGKMLDRLDAYQLRKYNDLSVMAVEFPETVESWKYLMNEYGNLVLTMCAESNEHAQKGDLLIVIQDSMF